MHISVRLFGIVSVFSFFSMSCADWTWLYKKRFSKKQIFENRSKKNVVFEKRGVPAFSQLVFSWNAFRPKKGHFSFFAQAYNPRTKAWGPWHKMMEWGKKVQRSYYAKQQGNSKYVYVRLEADKKNLANGFRIKISAQEGASLGLLRGFSVCTADFTKFKSQTITKNILNLPSVYVRGVPKKSQMALDHPRIKHLCSPTSCSMLTSFLSRKKVDPLEFAKSVFDCGLDTYGSWPFNVAHAFERCRGNYFFSIVRLHSFENLHRQLRRRIPIVVSVRGHLKGAPKVYDNGHLLVVVGWDAKRKQVICHDSALEVDEKTLKRYDIQSFLSGWERSHRLAYFAEPNILG